MKNHREYSLDTMCQEYTSFGVGDFRISSFGVVQADGSRCAEFKYSAHEILPGKYRIPQLPSAYDNGGEAQTLIVTLKDPVARLTLRLYYGVYERRDVLTRAAEIVNDSCGAVSLTKAASVCLDIPYGSWDLIHFHGRHCMERQPERAPLSHSVQVIASERTMSSHQQNPFVILCDHQATEESGDCYGLMLAYSGSFKAEIAQNQLDDTRLVMGINESQFSWKLGPREHFYTPEVLMVYSEGLTRLSHLYHAFLRNNVVRGRYKKAHRPVLINSWEASYFDISEEKMLALAKEAAELDIELFVLDDGWYHGRRSDNAGLGDWFESRDKLPHGLSYLIEKINTYGLDFGI